MDFFRSKTVVGATGLLRSRLAVVVLLLLTWLAGSGRVTAEPITLNLKDADITALISQVSELTGKNFVVDPRVKGKVTLISAHPMERDEVYQVFLSILDVHGFATIPGKVIKIVPDVNAKQSDIPTVGARIQTADDQVVTRVIQVQNVTAAQLVPILRPLVPQQGHLAAYPATNVLIISDRAGNVDRIAEIVARIDQASDTEIEVIPLEHASAAEVVRILTSLQQQADKGAPVQEQIRLIADERTNSVLLGGDRGTRLRLRAIIEHLDTPLQTGGNTRVIYLRYANAADLVPVLTGISTALEEEKKKGQPKAPATPASIQADEASNALVITAPPDVFRSLQTVISQLDIRRAQVLIEAVIAEVSADKTRELGVEWIFDGTPGGSGPIGVVNFGGTSAILNAISQAQAGNIPSLPQGATLGAGRFDSSSMNFAALVRALANDANTNILSTPTLVTLDNQLAEIVVGQNVPFVTGQFTTTGTATGTVNPFQTIQRQDVGLTLRVTPQINEGNAVKLEIEQESSSIAPSAAGATDLITNKRQIRTTVMIEDGHTIVLGGLIQDNLQQTEQKVPLLGDVPIFGNLFRFNRTTKMKQNLMVFLHPVIVRDAATAANVSGGKYSYMRAQQLAMRQKGVPLLADEESPVLPEAMLTLPAPFSQGVPGVIVEPTQ